MFDQIGIGDLVVNGKIEGIRQEQVIQIKGDFVEVFIEPRVDNDAPAFCKPQTD